MSSSPQPNAKPGHLGLFLPPACRPQQHARPLITRTNTSSFSPPRTSFLHLLTILLKHLQHAADIPGEPPRPLRLFCSKRVRLVRPPDQVLRQRQRRVFITRAPEGPDQQHHQHLQEGIDLPRPARHLAMGSLLVDVNSLSCSTTFTHLEARTSRSRFPTDAPQEQHRCTSAIDATATSRTQAGPGANAPGRPNCYHIRRSPNGSVPIEMNGDIKNRKLQHLKGYLTCRHLKRSFNGRLYVLLMHSRASRSTGIAILGHHRPPKSRSIRTATPSTSCVLASSASDAMAQVS
ncbi:hypothetical protein M409DRAFT_53933 [Zasmidium cellare ATCC 36951]|uniref:Uncharacterized protein n=1 Tax=Zasmidium cellare ATCC 36951 TaxID=1080233 RepID=A0A6A6CNL7_ZASCE|nr:uncharacterized protein M409DRAFT_53933 [Zasmidium cellare ATCC 36951]KAF2167329.1 hypothetical protein M409DRAFT_53933 [Zasmidium cellare ATCC 36951]